VSSGGSTAEIRDVGLLDSAAHRPQAGAFGQEAYPTIHGKAAALLDAVVRNHALVDGNKRLGWAAAAVFYDLDGFDLDPPSVDEAVDLVVAVAAGHLELGKLSRPWPGGRGRGGPDRRPAQVSAGTGEASSSRARRKMWSSMGSVRRRVLVFCWLTW
jgi:death-on-curing protein